MKVTVSVDGVEGALEFRRNGTVCEFRFKTGQVGDLPHDLPHGVADIEQAEPGVYSVLLEGRSYEARVEQDGSVVVIDGQRFEVAVQDPRRRSRRKGGRGAEGRQNVAAPMPGKVVRLLVEPGDSVVPGQGLVVVEAMKMQNEMKAPKAGRVVSVAARAGATVAAGEVLATIE